ncbi:MAG: hypothetical protein AAF533_20290 [Acidobacteriota bacterium]
MATPQQRPELRLLASELVRLRGQTSLDAIVGRIDHLARHGRCAPISKGTLLNAEKAQRAPGIDKLAAMALAYGVSPGELADLVGEGLLTARFAREPTFDASVTAFHRSAGDEDWGAAIAHARQAETLAPSASLRRRWRANRALAMESCGLLRPALAAIDGCLAELEEDPPACSLLSTRAGIQAGLGRFEDALDSISKARRLVPSDLEPERRWSIAWTHLRILLLQEQSRKERGLESAIDRDELLMVVDRLHAATEKSREPAHQLWSELYIALSREHFGQPQAGLVGLRSVLEVARLRGLRRLEVYARLNMGMLQSSLGEIEQAEIQLARAAELAEEDGRFAEAFRAHFELHRLAREEPERAAVHLRACVRLRPYVRDATDAAGFDEMVGRADG